MNLCFILSQRETKKLHAFGVKYYLIYRLWHMGVRYETHLLIDELQREKILETQARQEQAVPVTVPVAVPAEEVTVPVAVPAEEVPVPVAVPAEEVTVPVAVPTEEVTVPVAVPAEEVTVPVAVPTEEVTVSRRIPPHHRRTASVRLSASELPPLSTSLRTPSHGGSDETPAPLEISPETTTAREEDFTDHALDVSDDTPRWRTLIYSLVLGIFNVWTIDNLGNL